MSVSERPGTDCRAPRPGLGRTLLSCAPTRGRERVGAVRTRSGVVVAGGGVPVEAPRDAEPRLRAAASQVARQHGGAHQASRARGVWGSPLLRDRVSGGRARCTHLDGEDAVVAALVLGAPGVVGVPSVEEIVKLALRVPELAVIGVGPGIFRSVVFRIFLAFKAVKKMAVPIITICYICAIST